MRYSVVSDKGVVASAQSAGSAHRASRRSGNVGSSVRANRAGKSAEVATRYVGNCQACEKDFKLYSVVAGEPKDDDLRMVHHGYKRPGYGYIFGDCPGVGELPYERSKAIVESVLAGVEVRLARAKERLQKFESGAVTAFSRFDWRGKEREYRLGVTEPLAWQRAVENEIHDTTNEIRQLEGNVIPHLQKRIAVWSLLPVRTFDEIVEKEQAKKRERAEIVAARREAAAEKRRQIDAKHAAAAEKKRVFLAQARDELIAAASLPTREEARKAAEKTIVRLQAKKNRSMIRYWDDLDADDALIKLGYAEVTQPRAIRRDTGRPYMTYHLRFNY